MNVTVLKNWQEEMAAYWETIQEGQCEQHWQIIIPRKIAAEEKEQALLILPWFARQ
jgi:hypothetical protein